MRDFGTNTSVSDAGLIGRCAPSASLCDHIAAGGFVMSFERNEEIFGQGETADFIYRVIAGTVRSVRYLGDGRRQIEAFFSPGDVFGFESGPLHSLAAEGVTDCRIALVRRNAVEREAAQAPAAANALWRLAAGEVGRMREHMLRLARKGAVERVAAFLIELEERVEDEDAVIDLPMSRTDIADHLGLTIETVSRTITQLEREGVIGLDGARRISILNPDALTERAG